MNKVISVVFYGYQTPKGNWTPDPNEKSPAEYVAELDRELKPLGVDVKFSEELETVLDVRGYGDYLNTVRLRSPKDSIGNLCLGHIIGQSANCNLFEDIRRGVTRIAFAPETIEPEGENKTVCHNCGCGC